MVDITDDPEHIISLLENAKPSSVEAIVITK